MDGYYSEPGEYKGHRLIVLKKGDRKVVQFGLGKAQAILACVDNIRRFVADETARRNGDERRAP